MNTARIFEPWKLAIVYAILASGAAVSTSLYEGSFWEPLEIQLGGTRVVQQPYIQNFSTILDFALLNPIAIFFVLKANAGYRSSFEHFGLNGDIAIFHKVWLSLVAVVVACATMKFYFDGFVGQDFYSAAFAPTVSEGASITITGWIIFVFTSIFIAIIIYAIFEFSNYTFFVLRLEENKFSFRLPPSFSSDFKIAVAPCVHVYYLLTTLFVILVIFVLRDYIQLGIDESRRVWLLAPYILACIVVFVPFAHLHRIMKRLRDRVIEQSNAPIEQEIGLKDKLKIKDVNLDNTKLLNSIDKIQKLQSFYGSIPIWPASKNMLLIPNISFILSLFTILYKIIHSFIQLAQ